MSYWPPMPLFRLRSRNPDVVNRKQQRIENFVGLSVHSTRPVLQHQSCYTLQNPSRAGAGPARTHHQRSHMKSLPRRPHTLAPIRSAILRHQAWEPASQFHVGSGGLPSATSTLLEAPLLTTYLKGRLVNLEARYSACWLPPGYEKCINK